MDSYLYTMKETHSVKSINQSLVKLPRFIVKENICTMKKIRLIYHKSFEFIQCHDYSTHGFHNSLLN